MHWTQDYGHLGARMVLVQEDRGDKKGPGSKLSYVPFHSLKLGICQTKLEPSEGFPNTYGKIISSS